MINASDKNPNRGTKILLYAFENAAGSWTADGDDWYRWAIPVYRNPQGSWAETSGFNRQKVWFIEKLFGSGATDPNNVDFPDWFQCYWDSQAGRWVILSPSAEAVETIEPNPGVVTARITSESTCLGETFAELGYHAFIATILSRPFGSPTEMRKERSGELTVFDPHGCWLDLDYLPTDFLPSGYSFAGTTVAVSLMYGGEKFDEEYNFKGGSGFVDGDVITTDTYETFRPVNSCKPFGWIGGERTGYTASIGPIIPNGITTFQVKLPERGIYRITITYGDATDATDNQLELFDGDRLLATMTGTSETGQTWIHGPFDYDFKSSNAPLLKVTMNNASDRDTRIVKLEILQVDPPTQWEVINRCCIPKDFE